MEEFYRKKYLSPTYSRGQSGAESLQRDKTVAELRKELAECKQMEEKFDDLSLEIVRLERENKKIESQQSLIEGEYIEKVKNNKAKITQLKQAVLDCRESIEAKAKKIARLQSENQRLSEEISRLQLQLKTNSQEQNQLIQNQTSQEVFIAELTSKLQEGRSLQSQLRNNCQQRSQELDISYKQLRVDEARLKEEEAGNQNLKKRLEELQKERLLWEKKVSVSQTEVQKLSGEVTLQREALSDKENICSDMERESGPLSQGRKDTKDEVQRLVVENGKKAQRLGEAQRDLVAKERRLQEGIEEEGRVGVREMEGRKENERLRGGLKQLTEVLTQEQDSYSRVISHMKQSIQQDEKAIEGLVKQAAQMQNMIV